MKNGLYKSIKKQEIKTKLIEILFLQEILIMYHNIHIIQALTTDASKPTNKQKTIKNQIINILLITIGKNLNKNHKKIMRIVILNQLTAIK